MSSYIKQPPESECKYFERRNSVEEYMFSPPAFVCITLKHRMNIILPARLSRDGTTNEKEILVEESFTGRGATEAGNTISTTDLALKFVVVCEFLTCKPISTC